MGEILTNPWFIGFTVINIVGMVFLGIKFYHKYKKEKPLLFERLRDADINITIRKPIQQSDLANSNCKDLSNT